jgi:calcium-dependent protein kinase
MFTNILTYNSYECRGRIGKGAYGKVYKVFDKKDGKYYALKTIEKEPEQNINDFKEKCKKEINTMKILKSKYVVKLKDNFYDKSSQDYCIVMELYDGNLKNILDKYKPNGLPLEIINKIFMQLNDVLKEMIKMGCVHRDLKPENILIKYLDKTKKNFDIKLADFGLSAYDINSSIHTHSCAGTKIYMAPEIETCYYNNKCDLWSLGVILYELYTNKYIFYSEKKEEIDNNRRKGIIVKETDNEMINKLIRKLIQVDINKRIEWEKYFEDDFFKINQKDIKINTDKFNNESQKNNNNVNNNKKNNNNKNYKNNINNNTNENFNNNNNNSFYYKKKKKKINNKFKKNNEE